MTTYDRLDELFRKSYSFFSLLSSSVQIYLRKFTFFHLWARNVIVRWIKLLGFEVMFYKFYSACSQQKMFVWFLFTWLITTLKKYWLYVLKLLVVLSWIVSGKEMWSSETAAVQAPTEIQSIITFGYIHGDYWLNLEEKSTYDFCHIDNSLNLFS